MEDGQKNFIMKNLKTQQMKLKRKDLSLKMVLLLFGQDITPPWLHLPSERMKSCMKSKLDSFIQPLIYIQPQFIQDLATSLFQILFLYLIITSIYSIELIISIIIFIQLRLQISFMKEDNQQEVQTEQLKPEQKIAQNPFSYTYKKHKKGRKLKINTSRSRGELKLLKMLIKQNEWLEVFKEGDLLWSGLALPNEQIDLATEIRVNRIPAMPHLCHKRTMGFILNKFRQYWPDQFWFFPKTYLLPEDEEELQKKITNTGGTFIAKPSAGCQGDGIILVKKLSDIPKLGATQWIVQPYIDNPLLLQNKKFDFRLYVMISSIDPYICYLSEQGLVRFCSQDYEKPTKQNFKNSYIHLTNYSLNKNHPKYVNGDNAFSRGGKRCLKVVWEDLLAKGVDVGLLKQRVTQLTQKFLVGFYPFIKYYYNATFPKKNGKTFHVIGIDILVDENLQPWLLEANNNPSFNIEHQVTQLGIKTEVKKQLSPVDQYVKRIVVEDSIFMACRSLEKQKSMEIGQNFYSYKKILDAESEELQDLNIIQNILKLFHSQCSIRSKWVLTASQFTKLARLNGMTNEKISKNDYHLIFIKIMRNKPNPNQMEFEDFIQAIEHITKEIVGFTKQNKLEVMQEHVDYLVGQL